MKGIIMKITLKVLVFFAAGIAACNSYDSLTNDNFEQDGSVGYEDQDNNNKIETMYSCDSNDDCIRRPACPTCECAQEAAINKEYVQDYLTSLACDSAGQCRPGLDRLCTDRLPVCVGGECMLEGDDCDCNTDWDPVCVFDGNTTKTLANPCQAACLDLEISNYGRCDCIFSIDEIDPVCAINNRTFNAGKQEVECNGLEVIYPGSCKEECDHVFIPIPSPWHPVCGADFQDYADYRFAECNGVDWWHREKCLDGEGALCGNDGYGGTIAIECPSDKLICVDIECPPCLPENHCPCYGSCVLKGSCMSADDCWMQGLEHPEDAGTWVCLDHNCEWVEDRR
jgi:hypothetical protein